ncbi:hypothetical protein J3F84DRAFT_197083 [Trichoderma pleuroticola]
MQFGSRPSLIIALASASAPFPLVSLFAVFLPCCSSPVVCHEPTTLSTPPCSLQDPPLPLSAQLSRATTPASDLDLWNFLYTRCRLSPPDCMYLHLSSCFLSWRGVFFPFLPLFFFLSHPSLSYPFISPTYCLAQLRNPHRTEHSLDLRT